MPDPLGAPPPGPLIPDDPYAAILREQAASRTQRLKTSLIQADQTPPDRAADILRLVKETGIPGAIIDRNYDTIRTRARITNTPYHDIAQHSPALGEWASEPVNAQVAHDDMENLGWLEWVMTAPQQAVMQTLASQGYGALRSRELFGETLTQAEHNQLDTYRHDMRQGGALGVGPSWFSARGVIVETAKLATMIGSSYPVYGLAGAAVLGTAGAVAGTFVEPGAGTVVGAVQGARLGLQAGSTYGMAKMAFQTSAAAAYDEFLETPIELGHRMDPAAARVAALAYGAANAGIMVIGGKVAKGAIERGTEKLGEVVVRDTIKAALRQPSVRKALADVALRAGKTLTEGAAIGVAMEGAKILAEAYGRSQPPAAAAGGPGVVPAVGPPQASTGERLLHAAVSGAQMMTGVAGYEAAASVPYERARIQQAQQNVAVLEALGGTASASKTLKRAPDAVQDFVARVTKNGPVETIYVPTDKWTEYWQSQGLDPAAVATQVTGSADAYRTAEAQGRDLPISTARYTATLAGTEHHAGLMQDLRLGSPEAMTGNEAKKAEAAAVADIEKQITDAQAAGAEAPPEWQDSPMRQQVLDLLVRGGKYTPETAAPMADLAGAVFGNMATRAGVDPAAFFDQYQLRITRPDLEARGVSTEGPPKTGEAVPATPEEVATAAGTVTDQVTPDAVTTPAEAGAPPPEPIGTPTPAEPPAGAEAPTYPPVLPGEDVYAYARRNNLGPREAAIGFRGGQPLEAVPPTTPGAAAAAKAEQVAAEREREARAQARLDAEAPVAETGSDVGRPPESRARARTTRLTAGDRLAPSVARDREVKDAGGRTRVVKESPTQRATRAATHYDDVFRVVYAAARELDPAVNRRALRREFDARVAMFDELQHDYRTSEADPRTLLRAIAGYGGLAEKAGGQAGEIADVKSGTTFGALGGVAKVFRTRTTNDIGVPVTGLPLDLMLQHLQQTGEFRWLENTNQLLDALDEIARNPPQQDYLPGTDELYTDLRIDPSIPWWDDAVRGVDLTDAADLPGAEAILEPDGPVDTSFNVEEFNQSLFDHIEPPDPTADRLTADVLDTGEVQPRLPGAEAVRDQEVATPELEAPFALTSEIAKPRTKQETLFQTVYHGTPRTEPFEAFSLHAIGSGEGNQAYGYGLYFASQRAIAEHYRTLERPGSRDWTVPGAGHVPDWVARRLSRDATAGPGTETFRRAVDALLTEFKARVGEAEERVASQAPQWWNDQMNLPGLRDVVESLAHIRDTGVEPQRPGRLYTVDIPDDEHFLDYDQPLSQQAAIVQDALRRLGIVWTPQPVPTLTEAAALFDTPRVREQLGTGHPIGDWLDEGLWYVQTENVRDFQQWFDRHAQLLTGQARTDIPGRELYDTLQQQARDAGHHVDLTEAARTASEQLAGVGVTGIRYLDGNSRSQGEGSSNYVLFDPKLAKIVSYDQRVGVRPLEAADVSDWADAVRARVGSDLQAFDVGLNRVGDLLLHKIVIDRGAQRAGLGSRVLQELTRLADLNGTRILLTPADRGDGWGTSSRTDLVRFYQRFGFVENDGRQRDYAISAGMYREPTAGPGLARAAGRPIESPAFRQWFGDSHVVEPDGTPQVVYHGTTRDFTTFKPAEHGNIESDFGRGIYLSNNPADVGANYATEAGPDLVSKIERRAEQLANDRGDGEVTEADRQAAQAEHVEHGGATVPVYLKLEHPVILGGEGETRLEMAHPYDAEGEPLDQEPTGTLIDFTTALREVAGDFHDVDIDETIGRLLEAADYEGLTADKVVELLKADEGLQYATDDQGELASSEIIRQAFEQAGYDGIIDRTVDKKFGSQKRVGKPMAGMDEDTVHYIAFAPEQVKSAIGNRGTFDPGDPNILHQEGAGTGPVHRGAIRLGPGRQVSIDLLERADLSTFLHEGGHLFLEVFGDLTDHISQIDAAARTASQNQLLADYAGLLKHLGAETRADIGRERHEEFARTFEAYLGTGKAPSVALEGAFARFRSWLLEVYTSLKRLNVRLTPEVTGILDRMVASDRAIQQAEARRGLPTLFTTPESAGMTPAQFDLYRDTITKAHRRAVQTLDEKLLADVKRQRTAEWKAQRADIEDQVTAGVHEQPVYRALAAMQRGREPNGDLIGGPATREGQQTHPQRLSRQILLERYGAERLRRLPPFIYSREGGLDPDTVARDYGYSSGDEMLTAVEQAPPMRAAIAQETARRMVAEHGDLLLDGTLHEQAAAALANDRQTAVIRAELKALGQLRRTAAPFIRQERAAGAEQLRAAERERAYERRWFEAEAKLKEAIAVGKKQVEIDALQDEVDNLKRTARGGAAQIRAALAPDDVLRAHAQAQLQGQTVRGIRPELYWTAARRAGQAALDRAARQDFDGAITAKQNELINLHLYREAVRLKDDVDARTQYAKGLTQAAARKRIGKAGGSYLEQIDGILDRYDFAAISQKAVAQRASLREWADGLESQGISVDLPAEVLNEARRVHYSELTVEQLTGVTDALKQIDHLATTKGKLLKAAGDADYATVRDAAEQSIRAHGTTKALPLEFRPTDERARMVGDWFASHRKLADLSQAFDGYQDGGAFWTAFMAPINAASDASQARKRAAATAIDKLRSAAYPGRELATLHELQHLPAINASLSKEARLALALNWGNETSRQRVLNDPIRKWNTEQVEAILDTLDKRDWDFVQGVWDHVNSYWPEIAAKQQRVVGVPPEKVEAVPVQTTYGEYAGGYYPLKYEGRLDPGSARLEAASQAKLGVQAAYVRTTTKRGHTEARLAHVRRPIRYELSVLSEHVEQVIHDLTHHEMLIDTTRLIRDPAIETAIVQTRGDLVYKQFTEGLKDLAIGSTPPARNGLEKAANYVRTGGQLAALGWNVWTAAQQPLGLFNGMDRVGVQWVLRGLTRWMRDAPTMESTMGWIASHSPMMAERFGGATATQDLHELRASFRQAGGWFDTLVRQVSSDRLTQQTIIDSFLWHIAIAQRVADVPTWLGQYEKSMAAGEPEARAFAIADQAVLDSQGGGSVKDLAQIQRGGPLARIWMTFYSYGNVMFNATTRNLERFNQTRTPAGLATFLGHLSLLYVMPAFATTVLGHAFGRQRSDDDAIDWLSETAGEGLTTALNTIVGVREFTSLGTKISDRVFGTDLNRAGGHGYEGPAGARFLATLSKLGEETLQGKWDQGLEDALFATGGMILRAPAAQAQRTIDGFAALESGKTTNPFVLLVGPPKKAQAK